MMKVYTLIVNDDEDNVSSSLIRKILNNNNISVEDITLEDTIDE